MYRQQVFVDVTLTAEDKIVFNLSLPPSSSSDGNLLLWSTVLMAILALAIPSPAVCPGVWFCRRCRLGLFVALMGITLLYVVSVELNKLWFYRASGRRPSAAARDGETRAHGA